jgi:hypothetical protein
MRTALEFDRRSGVRRALASLLVTLMLVGCASLDPSRMVPDTSAGSARKIPLRVRVAGVNADQQSSFGGPALVDRATLSAAVIAALNKSGVFSGVSMNEGDVDLVVSVLTQDQKDLAITHYQARMLIAYKFTGKDGKVIWSETYETTASSTALGGASRTLEAREGAVRGNLAAMIQGVKERWPAR